MISEISAPAHSGIVSPTTAKIRASTAGAIDRPCLVRRCRCMVSSEPQLRPECPARLTVPACAAPASRRLGSRRPASHPERLTECQGEIRCHFLPFQCSMTAYRSENPPTAQTLCADGAKTPLSLLSAVTDDPKSGLRTLIHWVPVQRAVRVLSRRLLVVVRLPTAQTAPFGAAETPLNTVSIPVMCGFGFSDQKPPFQCSILTSFRESWPTAQASVREI